MSPLGRVLRTTEMTLGALAMALVVYGMIGSWGQSQLRAAHHLHGLLPGVGSGKPHAVLTLGLLMLLGTPVCAVFVTGLAALLRRNWRPGVLALLAVSIVLFAALVG